MYFFNASTLQYKEIFSLIVVYSFSVGAGATRGPRGDAVWG